MKSAAFSEQPACNAATGIFLQTSAISRSSWRGAGFEHQRAGAGAGAGAGGCSGCVVLDLGVLLTQTTAHSTRKPWGHLPGPSSKELAQLHAKSCAQVGEKSGFPFPAQLCPQPQPRNGDTKPAAANQHPQHVHPAVGLILPPRHRGGPLVRQEKATGPDLWVRSALAVIYLSQSRIYSGQLQICCCQAPRTH